ncbi:MAG: porin [Aquabacterium sp.]
MRWLPITQPVPSALRSLGEVKSTDGTTNVASKSKAYLLGASYDFGVAKAFAQYGRDKVTTKNVSGDNTDKFYQVGTIVPVTDAGSVHAAYGRIKNDTRKVDGFSLAYNHSLSKRTGAYAGLAYTKLKFDGVADAVKTTAVAVGVRHSF